MKKIIILIASAATLAGCAAPGPGPGNYGSRGYGYAQSGDPNGWQTVSVTPVPLGTGARAGDAGVVTSSNVVVNPAPPGAYQGPYQGPYRGAPVYAPQPVYGYPPVYVQHPYYTPPVSIGLGLSFGRSWGGHRHRGHYRRR